MKAIVQDEYGSPGMKHHRVVVTRHGGPDVLQVLEEDLPEPGAGEVRVKVLAAGVSALSIFARYGPTDFRPKWSTPKDGVREIPAENE
jgi:NADPH:quinone reductase-like Zn-dependent oxidoreductase